MRTDCIIIAELFESNHIHISTAAWSLSITTHPQSLFNVANTDLLYMGAGEIAAYQVLDQDKI